MDAETLGELVLGQVEGVVLLLVGDRDVHELTEGGEQFCRVYHQPDQGLPTPKTTCTTT